MLALHAKHQTDHQCYHLSQADLRSQSHSLSLGCKHLQICHGHCQPHANFNLSDGLVTLLFYQSGEKIASLGLPDRRYFEHVVCRQVFFQLPEWRD